ncbi:[NiFe]-hydrogenase assembly chaperone HybE [Sedimenticola thiotaurini]|uniref:[NiFe]-hydrogenase assembly chaperone HybE n=1 Tax=Sedimenticola thiotaurini TaxID=1543721 RepID=UPI00069BA651|nr:[NiFe]-hydrogenase assembly chaperone HybE [Sedimenticola thiotaurini]
MKQADRPVLVTRLEGLFRYIEQTRMAGIPILNLALQVEAVGFSRWNDYQLGVLITPWFMNLVLLGEGADVGLAERPIGDKIRHRFPSGVYEFIVAEEPALGQFQGRYQACSLFSPMQQFTSQQLAVETAQAVMTGVMQDENRSGISTREQEIARVWGSDTSLSEEPAADPEQGSTLSERLETPLTRRELLTGPS